MREPDRRFTGAGDASECCRAPDRGSPLPLESRLAVAVVYWSTPVAIRGAARVQFSDKPAGYKGHLKPTRTWMYGCGGRLPDRDAGHDRRLEARSLGSGRRDAPVARRRPAEGGLVAARNHRTGLATLLCSRGDLPLTCLWVIAVSTRWTSPKHDGRGSTVAAPSPRSDSSAALRPAG